MSKFQDKNIKVLAVDDDKESLPFFVDQLKEFVGKAIPANNGQEAMFKFTNEPFHLIITVVKMAKMDGIQLASSARKINSNIPIIFITDGHESNLKEISAFSNAEIISKPVNHDALENALNKLLGVQPKKVIVDECTIKANDTLFREGDAGDDMYFIKSGSFDVFKKVDGSEMFIVTLKAGEIVGELSSITGDVRSATVKAKEDTTILTIPKKKLHEILDGLPRWFKILLPTIISRLNETTLALANTKKELDKYKK